MLVRTTAWLAALSRDGGAAARNPLALHPAWGLIGVLGGTLSAVLLAPATGLHWAGALTAPTMALSLGLLAGPLLSAARSPLTALRAEHLLMLGLVYWLLIDAGQAGPRLWDVSAGTMRWVFALTGAFAASVWIGSALASLFVRPRPLVAPTGRDLGPVFLFLAGLLCAMLGFAQALATCEFDLACVAEALTAPRFAAPWYSGPGIKGFNTLLLNLKYFGYLTLPILVALASVERRISWRAVVLAPLALAFLVLLFRDGGRRELGSVVAASLLVWLLLRMRVQPRHYAVILGAATGLLLLMQVMLTWRDVGVGKLLEGEAPPARAYTVDRSLDWLAHMIEVVPARAPHTGLSGVLYVIGYPIPKSVWQSKPVQRGLDLPRQIGRSYGPGFSWTCTAVGDLYLIGGVAALVIGGLLFGIAANFTSRLLFRAATVRSRLAYAVIVMTLFLSLRALTELTAQGITVLALGSLFLLHWFVRRDVAPSPG